MMVLGRHGTRKLYKRLGLHRKPHHLMLQNNRLLYSLMDILLLSKYYEISPRCICTDSTKMGTKRVFSFQQKLSYFIFTRYQSSKFDIILRENLNLVRVSLYQCACKFSG